MSKRNFQNQWSLLQKDLQTASKTWEELHLLADRACPPEAEQMQEIKKILKTLQEQLGEFCPEGSSSDLSENFSSLKSTKSASSRRSDN